MVSKPKTPQMYREEAQECERLAEDAVNWKTRDALLYVAARWRSFANEGEAKGQLDRLPSQ
jgi:hypothetical protein